MSSVHLQRILSFKVKYKSTILNSCQVSKAYHFSLLALKGMVKSNSIGQLYNMTSQNSYFKHTIFTHNLLYYKKYHIILKYLYKMVNSEAKKKFIWKLFAEDYSDNVAIGIVTSISLFL